MKALFIGGTGTISTDVVALAQQRGWEITLLNRGSKKMPEGIHSIIADINDEELDGRCGDVRGRRVVCGGIFAEKGRI